MSRDHEPRCHRCSKPIANKLIFCTTCDRSFHPGCVKSYLAFNTASVCCKQNLLPPSSQVLSLQSSDDSAGSAGAGSLIDSFDEVPSNDSCILNSLLAFVEQLRLQIRDSEVRAEARFSTFVDKQQTMLNSIVDKLGCLNTIAESIAQINQRVESLESENATLKREVNCLKASHSREGHVYTDIVISGLPSVPSITPLDQIRRVFNALDASELQCHILDVRPSVRPQSTVSSASSDRGRKDSISSYFVSLTSVAVRRAIISKKRVKRILTQKEVDPSGSDRLVHVNEVFSKETYSLLQRTKRVAKEKSYKYVWCREGQICVRKSNGGPIIYVNSDGDLAKNV